MRNYVKRMTIPLMVYIAFMATIPLHTSATAIYFNMAYYWSLAIYYIVTKRFDFKALWESWKLGAKFWLPVLFTFVGMLIAFGVGYLPSMLFPNLNDGMAAYRLSGWLPLFFFTITLIPLPSIVEESFFRQSIIDFRSKKTILLTSIIGLILFGFSHTLNPLGAFIGLLWGVPLTISYIKTRNIYIAITAHFISNLIVNGSTIIFIAMELIKK